MTELTLPWRPEGRNSSEGWSLSGWMSKIGRTACLPRGLSVLGVCYAVLGRVRLQSLLDNKKSTLHAVCWGGEPEGCWTLCWPAAETPLSWRGVWNARLFFFNSFFSWKIKQSNESEFWGEKCVMKVCGKGGGRRERQTSSANIRQWVLRTGASFSTLSRIVESGL